jgi:hypothetical protein
MAASKSPRLRLLHMRDEIHSLSLELEGPSFETYRESYSDKPTLEVSRSTLAKQASCVRRSGIVISPSRKTSLILPWQCARS